MVGEGNIYPSLEKSKYLGQLSGGKGRLNSFTKRGRKTSVQADKSADPFGLL